MRFFDWRKAIRLSRGELLTDGSCRTTGTASDGFSIQGDNDQGQYSYMRPAAAVSGTLIQIRY